MSIALMEEIISESYWYVRRTQLFLKQAIIAHFKALSTRMIEIIAAISENNCIGKNGEIPWNISADMKRVKELTVGKVVIMGRKTWESIPPKSQPLPDRTNVIITSQKNYNVPEGVEIYTSIDDAISAHPNETIIGFGGQSIYEEMLPLAQTLYITHVPVTIESCDAFFPSILPTLWEEVSAEEYENHDFVIYRRKI